MGNWHRIWQRINRFLKIQDEFSLAEVGDGSTEPDRAACSRRSWRPECFYTILVVWYDVIELNWIAQEAWTQPSSVLSTLHQWNPPKVRSSHQKAQRTYPYAKSQHSIGVRPYVLAPHWGLQLTWWMKLEAHGMPPATVSLQKCVSIQSGIQSNMKFVPNCEIASQNSDKSQSITTAVSETVSFSIQLPPAVNARKRCALEFPQLPCWAFKWHIKQPKWPPSALEISKVCFCWKP